jgi:hypothetical protein
MDIFAEIEVAEAPAARKIITPKAQIIGGAVDPVRQKFYDMRGMASDNPYTWNDARLFYKQAKFMENFDDDYEFFAEFSMHCPCYQRMGYERLRTYFTWRSALSYIFLYVYENLMCVGTSNPAESLAGLSALRKAYDFPALDEYFPPWLKDFRVYYDLPTETEVNADDLLEWNKNSSYDIEKSKFFATEKELMRDCFSAAVRGLSRLCESKNIRVKDLFIRVGNEEIPWLPFRRAVFYPWLKQPDRTVSLHDGEVFYCRNNLWTTLHAAPYTHRRDLTGFIIKKTEVCARQKTDFKTKIIADVSSVFKANASLGALGITVAEIARTIEKSVAEFFFEKNRVVVNVNHKNLERIREEADDITDKLCGGGGGGGGGAAPNFEGLSRGSSDVSMIHSFGEMSRELQDVTAITGFGEPSCRLQDATTITGFGEPSGELQDITAITGFGEPSHEPHDITTIPALGGGVVSDVPATENDFVKSLSDVETEAVKIILAGGGVEKIKNFADEKNIMLEILVDAINEKAMDTIGDNIMELSDDIIFYDEYRNLF